MGAWRRVEWSRGCGWWQGRAWRSIGQLAYAPATSSSSNNSSRCSSRRRRSAGATHRVRAPRRAHARQLPPQALAAGRLQQRSHRHSVRVRQYPRPPTPGRRGAAAAAGPAVRKRAAQLRVAPAPGARLARGWPQRRRLGGAAQVVQRVGCGRAHAHGGRPRGRGHEGHAVLSGRRRPQGARGAGRRLRAVAGLQVGRAVEGGVGVRGGEAGAGRQGLGGGGEEGEGVVEGGGAGGGGRGGAQGGGGRRVRRRAGLDAAEAPAGVRCARARA